MIRQPQSPQLSYTFLGVSVNPPHLRTMICTHFLDSVFTLLKGVKPLPEQSEEKGLVSFSGRKADPRGYHRPLFLHVCHQRGYNFRQNIPQEMVAQC